jgi:hypothetical protein
MTHFTVAIIIPPHIRDIDGFITEQMLPYDETTVVAPYVAFSLDQATEDLKSTIHRLELIISRREQFYDLEKCREDLERLRQTTPDQRYQERLAFHDQFNDDGKPISTYNPASKWDWYVVGGRWDGWINNRESSGEKLVDNISTTELAIERGKVPHAVITPDGFWHENGQMGWFGAMLTENEGWDAEALRLFAHYPEHQVIIVDAHI